MSPRSSRMGVRKAGVPVPRGVVIPQVRTVLFDAAERVLLRAGPGGMTGRSITREAGVATGLLYRHFTDLDEFLAEFVLDRGETIARAVAEPLARPGEATVAGNLTAAVEALGARLPAMAALVRARASVEERLRRRFSAEAAPSLRQMEDAFAGYLRREQELGRVRAEVDPESLSLALVGAAHHLAVADRRDELRRAVSGLTAAMLP